MSCFNKRRNGRSLIAGDMIVKINCQVSLVDMGHTHMATSYIQDLMLAMILSLALCLGIDEMAVGANDSRGTSHST